jgi:hypothetical protein
MSALTPGLYVVGVNWLHKRSRRSLRRRRDAEHVVTHLAERTTGR